MTEPTVKRQDYDVAMDWRTPLRKMVNREDHLGPVRLVHLRIIDPVEWYMGKNDEERRRSSRQRRRSGAEGWTAYTRVAPESSTPTVDVLQNDPAPAPVRAGHAGLSIKELSRRRDALRREHDAYFRGKARELLTGNEAVIETTAGIVRGRLVRFRNGAVFEQWHSSADGMGHAMSRIELEELDDPAPFLVDSLVRAVLSLGPEAQPLR